MTQLLLPFVSPGVTQVNPRVSVWKKAIAGELGVKYDTFRKAINDGRLKERAPFESGTNKSTRSVVDAAAADGMGTACTRVEERTFAAFGVCDGAPVRFESCLDVPKGGVLCALPALLANGLLEGAEQLLGAVKYRSAPITDIRHPFIRNYSGSRYR